MQGSFLLRKAVKPPHLQRMAIGRRQGRDQVEHPAQLQPRAHFLFGRRRVIGQGHDFDDLRGRCRLARAAALAPGIMDHDRTGCREQIGPPAADMAMIGQFGKTAIGFLNDIVDVTRIAQGAAQPGPQVRLMRQYLRGDPADPVLATILYGHPCAPCNSAPVRALPPSRICKTG
jgi:hypothetical protein